ncbi:hypothetical protein [Acrocarpospora catenulata]|uniref:hypothetical protein n=1 Tax=Acrocarpospora catenulata TaxID=2836182 RepID=UPI001BDAA53A|nr:hypothetical protein [Acrocarpospora catenulata]
MTLLLCSCSSGSDPEPASFRGPDSPAALESPRSEAPAPDPSETDEPVDEETSENTEPATDEDTSDSDTPEELGLARGTYTVTMSGIAGWTEFRREGTVYIVDTVAEVGTTNGVNPVDVCLVSGMPAALPEVGAIWFGSNSGCIPGTSAADFDMTYVELNGSTVTVQPDDRMAATLANGFTVTNDFIGAFIFAPVSGQMTLTTESDGTLTGTIDIKGYPGQGTGTAVYQAQISGYRT